MKQAYTPALEVSAKTLVSKIRELPLLGTSLVKVGDRVEANTPVLSAELPGDLTILRIADRMGFGAEDIAKRLKVDVGAYVKKGELLCEITTFFGLFTTRLESTAEGVVEFFTEKNAHLGIRHEAIPLRVNAYIQGEVIAVEDGKQVTIETEASLIQGIFGVGGERHGRILCLDVRNDEVVSAEHVAALGGDAAGTVLFGGTRFSLAALRKSAELGVSAIVTGSIDAETLASYVGYEIGVSITGDEDVASTVLVTEGFGELPISDRVMKLAKQLEGQEASVNGATQVRAGATRPEVIVPLQNVTVKSVAGEPKSLGVGAAIRVIRVPYFGCLGTIVDLPHEPMLIESGAKVRVLKAALDDGREVIVPRANVELL